MKLTHGGELLFQPYLPKWERNAGVAAVRR